MPHIKAIIFDLDDTLYPERDYVRSGYGAVGRYLRETLGREERFEDWVWQRFCRGETANAFDALSEHFQLALTGDQILELVMTYRQHTPDIHPYDGVLDLLSELGGNHRLGLVSDGFLPAQRLKLEALKLERFFDAVVFTEETGREFWKPSPVGFERISELLAVPHESCAYVSDNPAKDFIAPNALGWLTIQYIRPDQIHSDNPAPPGGDPQIVIRLPAELHHALRERE
jgi:putative hydrolase of the HAD superfamily